MRGKIQLLSADLINKIAAGEVIERPASIVKELLENSIDAGATSITLKIEAGGTQLIEVIDNGSGMDRDDAELAFIQHATSKINAVDDLEKISTLGFRGEALASIAGVSKAQIHTSNGTEHIKVTTSQGDISVNAGEARNSGTTVTIRDIFHSIPARRKFLRTDQTEYRYILETFINAALAHKHITFKLIKDGSTIYNLTATKTLSERLSELFKKLRTEKLLKINYDGPDINISGFVGHPETATSRKQQQYLFLNNRPISDRLLGKAIKDGFDTTIARDQHPIFFIFIDIPTNMVDVNVHPRKLEVRFTDPGSIYKVVRSSITRTLEKKLQEQLKARFSGQSPSTPSISFTPQPASSTPPIRSDRTNGAKDNTVMGSIEFTRNLLKTSSVTQDTNDSINMGSDVLQVMDTYILLEQNDKLLVIDQHAADERVKYEAIKSKLSGNSRAKSQSLLIPETLHLSKGQQALLRENKSDLARLGFEFDLSEVSTKVVAVPSLLAQGEFMKAIDEILTEMEESGLKTGKAFELVEENIIATMACHGSIRAGRKLHQKEARKLVGDLFETALPYSCPHGRPIIWEIDRDLLERQFKRRK